MNPLPLTPKKLALTLEPLKSFLDGLTLSEKVPKSRIKAVIKIKSGKTLEKWNPDVYSHKVASESYENEISQLEGYLKKYDYVTNYMLVTYTKAGKRKKNLYGRVFPLQSLELTNISRKTRNTLIDGLYYDFDLENAQIDLTRKLCQSNGDTLHKIPFFSCHYLER